jgi:hypothetical protein
MGGMSEDSRAGASAARGEGPGGPDGPDGAEERFEALVDDLCGIAGVTPPQGGSGFGRNAIRFEKKIFAMIVRGRLVVKLPRGRVDDLIDAGHGDRFDANKGTPMKEWFSLDPESGLPWRPLALEALEFARPARPAR